MPNFLTDEQKNMLPKGGLQIARAVQFKAADFSKLLQIAMAAAALISGPKSELTGAFSAMLEARIQSSNASTSTEKSSDNPVSSERLQPKP